MPVPHLQLNSTLVRSLTRQLSDCHHLFVSGLQQVPDASFDFVAQNQGLVRSLPLWAGAAGFGGLLLNRALSGVGTYAVMLLLQLQRMHQAAAEPAPQHLVD